MPDKYQRLYKAFLEKELKVCVVGDVIYYKRRDMRVEDITFSDALSSPTDKFIFKYVANRK